MKAKKPVKAEDSSSKNSLEKLDFGKDFQRIGLSAIGLGVLHLIPFMNLDRLWAFPLIMVGIFSLIVKRRSTFMVFGLTLIFVGLLNASEIFYGSDNFRWVLVGFIQIYWGGAECVKFFRLKNKINEKRVNKFLHFLLYLLLISSFVFYFYMAITSYSLYKIVDGERKLIDIRECDLPYEEVGFMCCVKSTNYEFLCLEEAQDYDRKINLLIEENQSVTKKENMFYANLGISFESPEGYFLVTDTVEGGVSRPYLFITGAVDEDGEVTGDESSIIFYDYSSVKDYDSFWANLIDDIYYTYDESQINEEITPKGYEIISVEFVGLAESNTSIPLSYYQKDVYFREKELVLSFFATDGLRSTAKDFEAIVNSIKFD